jgi:hypothetical protein
MRTMPMRARPGASSASPCIAAVTPDGHDGKGRDEDDEEALHAILLYEVADDT